MIQVTEEARKVIHERKIREMFLYLKYTKGPCNDNLCKMIPQVVISTDKGGFSSFDLLFDDSFKLYSIPPITKTIAKNKGDITIRLSKMGRKIVISGITYHF